MHLLKFVLLCITISFAYGYQKSNGHGRFEAVNSNRYIDAKSMETDTKFFLNRNQQRLPPLHDTPASSCNCSEFSTHKKKAKTFGIY